VTLGAGWDAPTFVVALHNNDVLGLDTQDKTVYGGVMHNTHTTQRNTKSLPLIAKAIRTVRLASGLGVRELGRQAGVAAPQISRLEKGEVRKPSVETLVSLARVYEYNPVPLLIMAGYFDAEGARRRLQPMFADGAELLEDWLFQPSKGETAIAGAREAINDPSTTLKQLQQIAYDVWMSGETAETLWDDAFRALAEPGESDDELQEIVAAWPAISTQRRAWLLQAARDHVVLSHKEFKAEMETMRVQEAQELAESDTGEGQ
jgi:transcriptional regulator with XRE-family HTH domain